MIDITINKPHACRPRRRPTPRVGVGIMSQLSIVALFLEMDYLRMLKIAPDIK